MYVLARHQNKELVLQPNGILQIDGEPVSVDKAVKFYETAKEQCATFPAATRITTLGQALEAEKEAAEAEIEELKATLAADQARYVKDRKKFQVDFEKIKSLKAELAARKRSLRHANSVDPETASEIEKLKKSVREKEAAVASEIATIRGRTKLTPEEMAAVAAESRLIKRIEAGRGVRA